MNIDKIAKLPMASKKPTKILTVETASTEAHSDTPDYTKTNQLQMQTKLIENVDERKSQLKKKIQTLLEAQMKQCPVTPRTPRTTGTNNKY